MSSTSAALLTTTAAAALLHCSRQHVVDLCVNGTLPFVRAAPTGGFGGRRPAAFAAAVPTRGREALWLYRAVAGKLVADPVRGMALTRRNLADRREVHSDGGVDAGLSLHHKLDPGLEHDVRIWLWPGPMPLV